MCTTSLHLSSQMNGDEGYGLLCGYCTVLLLSSQLCRIGPGLARQAHNQISGFITPSKFLPAVRDFSAKYQVYTTT